MVREREEGEMVREKRREEREKERDIKRERDLFNRREMEKKDGSHGEKDKIIAN